MAFIKANLRNLIIAGVVLIAGFFAYSYFISGSSSNTGTLSVSGPVAGTSPEEANLLAALADLKTIKLDDHLFKDPAFQTLINFHTAISDEPKGRPNPFAPLPGSGSAQGGSSIQIKSFKTQ